ncbi:MAG TPA: peptide chain release factor 1 [Thermoflexia bacterium]|nr:peptide chain release factor 1 [Thermoflexia bacterium]
MLERLDALEARFDNLAELLADPEIVQDYTKVVKYAKERSDLAETVETYRRYRAVGEELAETEKLLDEVEDAELLEMARAEIKQLSATKVTLRERLKQLLVPKDPRDEKNVIIEIRAGAGGDEAGLFAAELFRMYARYVERQGGWRLQIISENRTGIGGFKEVIFRVEGKRAFSQLKYESGVHRVQRVPTTESSGRIHTSTVTVAVLPEVEAVEININPNDLEIGTYGASGPGGQHMQKNDTAVRIIYKPTRMVVTCESERSLTQNKLQAMTVLRARLYEIERREQEEAIGSARRAQVGTGERSEKIRTYNYPQNRVTDHRIGKSIYDLPSIMEGEIREFIEALTADEQWRKLAALGE